MFFKTSIIAAAAALFSAAAAVPSANANGFDL